MMTNAKPMGSIQRRPFQQGFTLVEMMLVVAVIALISAIAIPAFIDYMKKSRRSDARSLLLEIVAKQEQYFPNNQQYTDNFTQLGNLAAKTITADKVTSDNGYYEITIDRPTRYAFTLTAKPIGAQANDSCTTLKIDQDGTKGFTPTGAVGCW